MKQNDESQASSKVAFDRKLCWAEKNLHFCEVYREPLLNVN